MKNKKSIIIIAIIVIIGIIGAIFALTNKDKIHIHPPVVVETDADETYTPGGAEIDADDIRNIKIEWIDGNVDIEYYDGEKIAFTEDESNYPLQYKVDKNELTICEYQKKVASAKKEKDLKLMLPMGFMASEIDLEIVSANVNTTNLNAIAVDVETASGNVNLDFEAQPLNLELESVSGDINLAFSKDISGYSVTKETVSGTFRANDFGGNLSYGNNSIKIGWESVSGNLIINQK